MYDPRIVAPQYGKHGILPRSQYLGSIPVSETETPCVSVFDLSRKWRKYPLYALMRVCIQCMILLLLLYLPEKS
jgi:hypothetical protein